MQLIQNDDYFKSICNNDQQFVYTMQDYSIKLDNYNDIPNHMAIYDLRIGNKWYLEFDYFPLKSDNDLLLVKEVRIFKNGESGKCFVYEYYDNQEYETRKRIKAIYLFIGKTNGYERYDAIYDNGNYRLIDCYGNIYNDTLDVPFFSKLIEKCEILNNPNLKNRDRVKIYKRK